MIPPFNVYDLPDTPYNITDKISVAITNNPVFATKIKTHDT